MFTQIHTVGTGAFQNLAEQIASSSHLMAFTYESLMEIGCREGGRGSERGREKEKGCEMRLKSSLLDKMEVPQGGLQQHLRGGGGTRPGFCCSRFCKLARTVTPTSPLPFLCSLCPLILVFIVYCDHSIIEPLAAKQTDERGERV